MATSKSRRSVFMCENWLSGASCVIAKRCAIMLLQLVVRRTAVGAVHSRRHAVPVCSCRKALQFAAWRISHGEATSLFTWIVSASEAVEICSLTTPYCGLPVRIEKVLRSTPCSHSEGSEQSLSAKPDFLRDQLSTLPGCDNRRFGSFLGM